METTEAIIQAAVTKFCAPRPTKLISAPGSTRHVHTDGEMILFLPNGAHVKVHTDASGIVTHVEENEAQHAIVRPNTYRLRMR